MGLGDVTERARLVDSDDVTGLSKAPLLNLGSRPISDLALRTEYQTVFKLPSSGCVVFAVHSYIDPLENLVASPKAAQMIVRATEHMNQSTLNYRGVNEEAKKTIIDYLESIYSNN